MASSGTLSRCLAVLVSLTIAAAGLLALTLPLALVQPPAPAPGPASFEDLLVRTCAVVASVGVAWLWLGAAAVTCSIGCRTPLLVLPGLPLWTRRLVLAACGAALVAAPGSPALATGTVPDLHTADLPTADRPVPDLPVPDRAAGTMDGALDPRPPTVTVRPGDSLWAIASRDLGEDASDAAIEGHWRALYDRNVAILGADPDLILPGQRLCLPEPGR